MVVPRHHPSRTGTAVLPGATGSAGARRAPVGGDVRAGDGPSVAGPVVVRATALPATGDPR